jgi:hypothetical protein
MRRNPYNRPNPQFSDRDLNMEESTHGHEEGGQESLEVGEEAGQEGEERQEEVGSRSIGMTRKGPPSRAALRALGARDRLPVRARARSFSLPAIGIVGE